MTTRLEQLRHYCRAYYARTTQLATSRIARQWMEAGIPAHQAAAWARSGHLPEEALPLIAAGMSPEMVVATDPATDEERAQLAAAEAQLVVANDQSGTATIWVNRLGSTAGAVSVSDRKAAMTVCVCQ